MATDVRCAHCEDRARRIKRLLVERDQLRNENQQLRHDLQAALMALRLASEEADI